jgi:cysteine desulfurase
MSPERTTDAIYLDFNATTPILPEVLDAMLPYLREGFGNPSSDHAQGIRAREGVELARGQVAALIGGSANEIVFTSCATESSNLAIRGVAATRAAPGRVVTSSIEHPATTSPCAELEARGWTITRVRPRSNGVVDVSDIEQALGPDVAIVTLMHANNEIGTIQPVGDVATRAHAVGAVVHTDAAQSIGKIPVRVDDLGVDLLTIAGHKVYAPKGVGALYVRHGTVIQPVLRGAGQEHGLRPGTENVASIVGLGRACELAGERLATERVRIRQLRDQLWERLRAAIPDLAMNGDPERRLPNTLSVRFPRVDGARLLAAARGVAASTGSACHSGEVLPPDVVVQLGVDPTSALGTVRLSLGFTTTIDHVTRAADALTSAWQAVTRGGMA